MNTAAFNAAREDKIGLGTTYRPRVRRGVAEASSRRFEDFLHSSEHTRYQNHNDTSSGNHHDLDFAAQKASADFDRIIASSDRHGKHNNGLDGYGG